jgi:glucans biosynthesis protein C
MSPLSERIIWLDGARGLLMIFGIFFHSAMVFSTPDLWPNGWLAQNDVGHPFFDWLAWIIHVFRMPAFFIVAGFFCAFSYKRFGSTGFLPRRLLKIGVPLLATALTLNIAEDYALAFKAGSVSSIREYLTSGLFATFWSDGRWQSHLWFLTYLLIYHLGFAGLARLVYSIRAPKKKDPDAYPSMWLSALQIYVLAGLCLLPSALAYLAPIAWYKLFNLFSLYQIAFYLPYFCFGVLAYSDRIQFEAFCKFRALDLPVLFLAVYVSAAQPFGSSTLLAKAADVYSYALAAWILSRLTFILCRALFTKSGVVSYLSDASFTIYLFHHLMVILGGVALANVSLPLAMEYCILVTGTFLVTVAIHHYLILPIPVLRLLFNGKALPRATQNQRQS